MSQETKFTSESGDEVALKRVHVDGRIDGLLWSMTSAQHYRNETGKNLETVYTFPLAPGAILLGITVQIGEKRLKGAVIEKKQATERYEKAIDDGDMPVMVEKSSSGLYTANLGNLKDGESVTIEIESAQLLRFEQGQMRLQIPTVIGERYGDAYATGGLAPHETAAVNALVEYPLTLKIDITGEAATAKMTCPSHAISTVASEQGLSVTLERNSFLDRDFILNFEGLEGQSFAVVSSNEDESWVVASFCPRLEAETAPQDEPLHLKILIDCSGSMEGDSIAQARNALSSVAKLLTPADYVSFSRFGSEVQNVIPKMTACTGSFVHGTLARAIHTTEANLGGTEIPHALASVTEISGPARRNRGTAILLITDGATWDIDSSVARTQRSRHRIFTIGVGSTPAGSLLRALADKTGGACEFVSPNEDMEAAILRTFRRMRSVEASELKVSWGGEPEWQSAMPVRIYENETLHLFAKFKNPPTATPELIWQVEGKPFHCSATQITERSDQTLRRLGGACEMDAAQFTDESLVLALKYQLVSDYSNLFLVHVRAEDEKASTLPALQRIEQMQAAGHSGFGTVANSISCSMQDGSRGGMLAFAVPAASSSPALWRGTRTLANQLQAPSSSGGMSDYEVPAFLRKFGEPEAKPSLLKRLQKRYAPSGQQKPNPKATVVEPQQDLSTPKIAVKDPLPLSLPPRGSDILRRFNALAWKETDFKVVVDALSNLVAGSEIAKQLDEIIAAGHNREHVWVVYLEWLIAKANGMFAMDRHAVRLLRHELSGVGEQEKVTLSTIFFDNTPA
jgi:Ca-activated chloride channel family protein